MATTNTSEKKHFNSFDENKDYKKILFNSDVPLQSQELNEIQSISQDQLSTISKHIFKKGSPISEISPKYIPAQPYAVITGDIFEIGTEIQVQNSVLNLESLVGKSLLGASSGLIAEVLFVKDVPVDGLVLFVDYKNSAADNKTLNFLDGELLEIEELNFSIRINCPDCNGIIKKTTGIGTLFSTEESKYFSGEFFLNAHPQTILISLDTKPNALVGFLIENSIITSLEDTSLEDPSQSGHISGADRLKIFLRLVSFSPEIELPNNFISVAEIQNGILISIFNRPQYSDLMDTLARRTHDESGSYTVNPFSISFSENIENPEEKFNTVISPGKAYVRGREIEYISNRTIPANKALETTKKRSISTPISYGNYIRVKIFTNIDGIDTPSNGITTINNDSHNIIYSSQFPIKLYSEKLLSSNKLPITAVQIGTVRIKTIVLEDINQSEDRGVDGIWTYNIYRLYVYEVIFDNPSTTKLSDISTFSKNHGSTQEYFVGEVISNIVNDKRRNTKIFPSTIQGVVSNNLIDSSGISSISMTVEERIRIDSVAVDGIVIIALPGTETYVGPVESYVCGVKSSASDSWPAFILSASNASISGNVLTIDVSTYPTIVTSLFVLAKIRKLNQNPLEKSLITDEVEFTVEQIDIDHNKLFLERADCFKILDITHIDSGSLETDVISDFRFKTNQKQNFYDISYIESTNKFWPAIGEVLKIRFQYFKSVDETLTGEQAGAFSKINGNFFSIDSYSNLLSFDPNFSYSDIPTYTFDDGEVVSLSDCFDFRGLARFPGKALQHSTSFDDTVIVPLGPIPVFDSNIIADIEHYFDRIDSLCITDSGEVVQISGKSENSIPIVPNNAMKLFEIYIPVFTSDISKIKKLYIDNRRYTMNDIGTLDKRISNLEEYIAFSLLEIQTESLLVVDENGFNRFKNGIIVSNFKSYLTANLKSLDFASGLNTSVGTLIPQFSPENIELKLKSGTNFKRFGNLLFQDFTEELLITQSKSSGDISVNPFFFYKRVGELTIAPSVDTWIDTTIQPKIVVDIDSGFDELLNSSNILETQWGAWETLQSETTKNRSKRGRVITDSVKTRTKLQQTGVSKEIENKVSKYDAGTSITSVSIQPFIRPIKLQLYTSGLLPNTLIHVFFEKENVDKYCINLLGSGLELETNNNGSATIIFNIPKNTFFVGKSEIVISNTQEYPSDPDEVSSFSSSTFFSGGLTTTSRGLEISVTTPTIKEVNISREKVVVDEWQTSWLDPVAQSFLIDSKFPNGVFLSSASVEFTSIGQIPVWLEVRNMINGIPASTGLGGSRVTLFPNQVQTGNFTKFTFNSPIHVNSDEEYCIVVGSASKEWRIKTSTIGRTDEATGELISTQPSLGSLFKSQNGSTWTPEQYKDLKFQLSICKFNENPVELVLTESKNPIFSDISTIETKAASALIRISSRNHNLQVGDTFSIQYSSELEIQVTTGEVAVGMEITGSNSETAIVKSVEKVIETPGRFVITIDTLFSIDSNIFVSGSQISAPNISKNINNKESLEISHGIVSTIQSQNLVANIITGFVGISKNYNNSFQVLFVNSIDEFTYSAIDISSDSTIIRPLNARITKNLKVDTFIFNFSYVNFGNTSELFNVDTSKTFSANGSTEFPNKSIDSFDIRPNDEILLDAPMVIRPHLPNTEDILINVSVGNDDEYSSPVIDLDGTSILGVSNRVEKLEDSNGNFFYDVGIPTSSRIISEEKNLSSGKYKFILKPTSIELPATRVKVLYELVQFEGVVKFYMRTGLDIESTLLDEKDWVLISENNRGVSSENNDFVEIEFESQEINDFTRFEIKIVIENINSSKPSRIRKLRVIAVT